MLIKRWKAYLFVIFPLTFTHNSRHGAKTGTDVLPLDKTIQGLIVLFPFDTAEGGIMGLLQATCIMPNSLRSLFSSLVIQSSSSQQPTGGKRKKKPSVWVPYVCAATSIHRWPLRFLGTEVRIWGRGAEERRGEDPCDSVRARRLAVIPLIQTIMWSHHWH